MIMAGNTRGRLKERFEGIHKNLDWVKVHCQESLELIGDMNPNLSEGVKALAEGTDLLDTCAQNIYSRL